MLPLAPDAGTEALAGLIATAQFWPNWVTVTTLLFTSRLPILAVAFTLAVTENANVPSPFPAAALWNVIHGTFDVAVQLQPAFVMISKLLEIPSAAAANVVCDMFTSHDAAACATVKAAVPMVMLAVLAWAVAFAVVAQLTVLLPDPLWSDVTVNHDAVDATCQVQGVVILKLPAAPVATAVAVAGEIKYTQLPPACCSVNTASPTVIRAVRALGVLFTVAVQAMVPLPVPDAPEDMVNQVESLTAVRLQLETFAVMLMDPVRADELIDWEPGLSVNVHAADCVTLNVAVPI